MGVNAAGGVFAARLVDVAHHGYLGAAVVLREELRQQRAAALDAEADHGHVGLLAWLEGAHTLLVGCVGGHRDCGGGAKQETSTVDV